MAFITHTIM